MSALPRWSDERLDELNRRLINVEGVTTTVAEVKVEQRELKTGLERANKGIEEISKKLTDVADEPLVRARDFRRQVLQGVIAAIAGGLLTFGAVLAGGAIH